MSASGRSETGELRLTLKSQHWYISEQLDRNRYYMSCIMDIVEFLAENQLPLRGSQDAFSAMSEGGSGLFLSLFEYTLRKDEKMAKIMSTIPRNATYTSHEIQNQMIEAMSSVVTEAIVKDIGPHWFTIKVDGTRDPTGCENVSIVVRFISEETSQPGYYGNHSGRRRGNAH